ncbi:hypothetical protein RRG08_020136 [Elysia crispata]|uniref:Uncharacterized protein n=1 Tax=Elysia crispata TaxID=231223 RepID=A0AAE1B385_9GAST|nr:hypothetical protein RRG08_020136 [Elysia crispata]
MPFPKISCLNRCWSPRKASRDLPLNWLWPLPTYLTRSLSQNKSERYRLLRSTRARGVASGLDISDNEGRFTL